MNFELSNQQKQYLAPHFKGEVFMVSGSTGLVGSAVVRYLVSLNDSLQAGITMVILYRDEEKLRRVHASLIGRDDIIFCHHTSDMEIDYSGSVDYIVHAEGISGGTKMHLKDPVKIFDIGIYGTKLMLDFAVSHGCKGFVYVSTYEIYGNINEEALISENHNCQLDPLLLRNSYAEVKRVCESMLAAYYAKYHLNVYSGRLTSTFGTGVSPTDPRFFAEFARCVAGGKNIVLKSTGGTVRSYLDVDDAASAFLYILANGENCSAYNLTNRHNTFTVKEIAQRLIELGGDKVNIVFDIAEDIKTMGFRKEGTTVIDPSKLESIGWNPVYSFDDTLKKLLNVFC